MSELPTSDRLKALTAMAEADPAKPFTWYGLAMEYKSLGRAEDAVLTFRKLITLDPRYVPAYHMLGRLFVEQGKADEARTVLAEGITVARQVGNSHAQGEMEGVLESLE